MSLGPQVVTREAMMQNSQSDRHTSAHKGYERFRRIGDVAVVAAGAGAIVGYVFGSVTVGAVAMPLLALGAGIVVWHSEKSQADAADSDR